MTRSAVKSVRDRPFAGNNGSRAGQNAATREQTDAGEDSEEHRELDRVGDGGSRQDFPEQEQHGLRGAYGPHGSIEVAALVALALRRRFDAREPAQQARDPDRTRQRKVREIVNLTKPPCAGADRVREAGGVEQNEGQKIRPGGGVADAPIQRIRVVLGEAQDVGFGLDSGELPEPSGDSAYQQHDAEPDGHARIEPAREEIEGERARRDKKNEDPDGPVRDPVVRLVAFAKTWRAVDAKLSTGGHSMVITFQADSQWLRRAVSASVHEPEGEIWVGFQNSFPGL